MTFDVKMAWAGALTDTSVWIRADTGPASNGILHLAEVEDMTGSVQAGTSAATTEGMLSFPLTGLEPGTRYWYVIETNSTLSASYKGTFKTMAVAAGERWSYTFGAAGDAGLTGSDGDAFSITDEVSDGPVFDTMRAQSAAEDWVWFSHLGDLHYRNITANDPAAFRLAYNDVHNYNLGFHPDARQGRFLRTQPITYVWDDHDFAGNNSYSGSTAAPAAQLVYRETVPHYPLNDPAGIWQSWQAGRVLHMVSDTRSHRNQNSAPQTAAKTMLGAAQKAWMESVLLAARDSGAEALVWQTPSRWLASDSATGDTWNSFAYERGELIQMFGDTGWLHRMIQLTADKHSLSMCTGPNNPWGGFPIYMFASMDCAFSDPDPLYDLGSIGGRRQYGTVRVADAGHTIALTGTGYRDGTALMGHTAYVDVGSPVFALDYTAGHVSPPLEPTDDDQSLRNDVTAKREDGSEARYVKTTGPLNTHAPDDDPDGVGVYDEGITLNTARDDQLPDQAGWRVHLGTVDEARYPIVHIDLAANPDLADQASELALGDKATIDNPPPWLPPDQIQLIVEGGTETIGLYDWDVVLNTSPGSAWNTAQLPTGDASTAGPNSPNRLDTSGSKLVTDVTDSATELLVHTAQGEILGHARWINSEGLSTVHPTHFPFDLRLGGEIIRASAIKPLGYDTFTRSVAGSWGTSTGGQAWTLAGGTNAERSVDGSRGLVAMPSAISSLRFQILPSAVADCEIRTRLSVNQVATGASLVPGILLRYIDTGNYYRARIHFATGGGLFASITRDTTQLGGSPQLPYTYTAGAEFEMRVRLIGHRILMRVWPVSKSEPEKWHHEATIETGLIETGQVGTTVSGFAGNTNASPVITCDNFEVITPQRVTATRSINTVVKAHTAGTAVSLAQPAIVAL